MTFVGTPAITQLSSNDLFTTAFAPIVTLEPIVILPYIFAPGPIVQLLKSYEYLSFKLIVYKQKNF